MRRKNSQDVWQVHKENIFIYHWSLMPSGLNSDMKINYF